jgi:hypothetical protein
LKKVRRIFGVAAHQPEHRPAKSGKRFPVGWNQRFPAQKKSGPVWTQLKILRSRGGIETRSSDILRKSQSQEGKNTAFTIVICPEHDSDVLYRHQEVNGYWPRRTN